MPLKTDYTNDILDTSKNVERHYVVKDASGTIIIDHGTIEDVTEYEREGSRFGANDINATNEAVNSINIYVGEDEKLHFVNGDGADSVLPFSNGVKYSVQVKSEGTSSSYAQILVQVYDYKQKKYVLEKHCNSNNYWAREEVFEEYGFAIGYAINGQTQWSFRPTKTLYKVNGVQEHIYWTYTTSANFWVVA